MRKHFQIKNNALADIIVDLADRLSIFDSRPRITHDFSEIDTEDKTGLNTSSDTSYTLHPRGTSALNFYRESSNDANATL